MTTVKKDAPANNTTKPRRTTASPSAAFGAPMAHVGLDLFNFAGKQQTVHGPIQEVVCRKQRET